MQVDRLLRHAVALATAVAGMGHLSAARDHPAHTHIAAFFVVLALAQFAWAAAIAFRDDDRRLLVLGLAGNAAVVAVWVLSRTIGIPFVPGADQAEAVALKDAVTTFAELLALGAGGLLLALPETARLATLPSPERVTPALFASALLLTVPATLGSHGHGEGHGLHGDAASHAQVAGASVEADHGHGGGDIHEASGQVARHDVEHVPAPDEPAHAHGGGAGATATGHAAADDDDHGGPGHEGHDAAAALAAPEPAGQVTAVRYGPFVLPPVSSNDFRHETVILSNTILTQLPPPCRDCYLTAFDFDLVYEDGRSANYDTGAMLHHHVMFDSSEDDPTCGRGDGIVGPAGKRLFASGNERTSGAFPPGYGLHVGGSDWWTGIFELMNLVEQPQTVWVEVGVRYLPDTDESIKALEPVWLDVNNCDDSEIDVPAGRTTTEWDWASDVTGRVVMAAGHVHDGGVSIALSNATTGARMCKSVARYGTRPEFMGHIDTMSACTWDRLGTVREGEVLRISTVYDSPQPLRGVMGIMMAFVYETDDLDGGTAAPESMTNPPESAAPTVEPHQH